MYFLPQSKPLAQGSSRSTMSSGGAPPCQLVSQSRGGGNHTELTIFIPHIHGRRYTNTKFALLRSCFSAWDCPTTGPRLAGQTPKEGHRCAEARSLTCSAPQAIHLPFSILSTALMSSHYPCLPLGPNSLIMPLISFTQTLPLRRTTRCQWKLFPACSRLGNLTLWAIWFVLLYFSQGNPSLLI